MAYSKQALMEWYMQFARNRDLIHNRIEKIDGDVIHYRDKEQKVISEPVLGDVRDLLKGMDREKHYALVVLNTKGNLRKVIGEWGLFAEFKHLTIIFSNPLSQRDKKWIVVPHIHSKISEERSLRRGLASMFEMVDESDGGASGGLA